MGRVQRSLDSCLRRNDTEDAGSTHAAGAAWIPACAGMTQKTREAHVGRPSPLWFLLVRLLVRLRSDLVQGRTPWGRLGFHLVQLIDQAIQASPGLVG